MHHPLSSARPRSAITLPTREHLAHFIMESSMAICLLLGFGVYSKEVCFYPQLFFQPLLILV